MTGPVFIADMDGSMLGVISLHAFDLFHQPARIGRITVLVVDAASRRQGGSVTAGCCR